MQILIYIICGLVVAFAIAAFVTACEQSAEKRRQDREVKKINEITTEANNTKADARTGDHERDFNYMADKLHEFAKK